MEWSTLCGTNISKSETWAKWSVFSDMVTYIRGCVFTVQLRDKVTRVSTSHAGVTICTCDCSTPRSPVARKFSVLCLLHVHECSAELKFCGVALVLGSCPARIRVERLLSEGGEWDFRQSASVAAERKGSNFGLSGHRVRRSKTSEFGWSADECAGAGVRLLHDDEKPERNGSNQW